RTATSRSRTISATRAGSIFGGMRMNTWVKNISRRPETSSPSTMPMPTWVAAVDIMFARWPGLFIRPRWASPTPYARATFSSTTAVLMFAARTRSAADPVVGDTCATTLVRRGAIAIDELEQARLGVLARRRRRVVARRFERERDRRLLAAVDREVREH